ncbi:hypothetical protein K469DRAFT_571890 [Zopfia rhizophila CBS 207.26]|uniref:Uncharacterized protein n=1 Tax=Zopfia rhizophila CBS 207.26 TaxID=1314779 RepID=A0A6A6E9H8_9PEZI|nr:hypothetical protein K469DRAFT_571890 [Zopfia rhizophila CBS 207.26]
MISCTNMPEPRSDANALLESSSQDAPKLKSHKPLPRRRDDFRSVFPAAGPLKQDNSYSDDEILSQVSSHHRSPLPSPGALNGADTGLPPTPPSNSQDQTPPTTFSPPPHADGVVLSLMSKKSSLSTPINQRSPPTPDPSPPRTTESMTLPDRPPVLAYPSSRAESFKTAREDQNSSDGGDSRSNTPLADRLSTVEEDRGLGLAFERDDGDVTPTNRIENASMNVNVNAVNKNDEERKDLLDVEKIPDREWDTNLMRNVTVRRKRNPKPQHKNLDVLDTATPTTGSTPRRSSSLRERVEPSKNSPQTPSYENFAQSIGWPTEVNTILNEHIRDVDPKRLSGSSMTSTVVEAMVIVTPPQRRRTLRHTGRNLAYRRDGDSSTDHSSVSYSNRNSLTSEDIPLHRLVHKRASVADRSKRISSDSDTLAATDRTMSPFSIRKRDEDTAAATLAHQESVKRVLQPAAEIMSRSNSVTRTYSPETTYHKRIVSAPEATRKSKLSQIVPQTFLELSPSKSPREMTSRSTKVPRIERTSPSTPGFKSQETSPTSPKVHTRRRFSDHLRSPFNINKSLPDPPIQPTDELSEKQPASQQQEKKVNKDQTDVPAVDDISESPAVQEVCQQQIEEPQESQEPPQTTRKSSVETVPTVIRRTSLSIRGRSEERRRSSVSQDRSSTSRDTLLHPHTDRVPIEELPRHSYEWHLLHPDDHRRISFDRSTARTEEHAMARHLYAQSTPFSQFSDTPDALEVSEATAVSIYPHNNHSLLVVQQVARSSTAPRDQCQVTNSPLAPSSDLPSSDIPSSPPLPEAQELTSPQPSQPTLTFEPSTPPMQVSLPVPGAVDSPLKNPRPPPEPPIIKFIPPTPAEELERQLPPGPPQRSDSRPQRRLSLVQRARRYSDNLISPLLARASSTRGRSTSGTHAHENPRVPSVNDEDGSLHPFWRPRGFWEGFEDSDTESEDDVLPQGGDTSDVEPEPERTPKLGLGVLGRRLTNGFKGSGGFLIGNSVGLERAGTNRRRHHVTLPAKKTELRETKTRPGIIIQPPTWSSRPHSPRVEKRGSRSSMRSLGSYERRKSGSVERLRSIEARRNRRESWRQGKRIPGLGMQVQYIGLSGVKERFRERKAEKRRDAIRRSIGPRYYVEGGTNVA